jgi:serine/threonine protein kinase
MARVWTSDNFSPGQRGDPTPSDVTPSRMTPKETWSRWVAALGVPVRGLSALAPGFQPHSGVSITPRLRLLYPLQDGYRVEEGQLDGDAALTTWVADHLGLGTRVEVTFAQARSMSVRANQQPSNQAPGSGAASSTVSSEGASAAAFQSRARVTAQINEPHLVRILEQGTVKGLPFIVTELLEGKSLRQRLLHGPASLAEAQTVVVQACDALAKAHAYGIAHGGLCPDVLYLVEVAEQPFLKIGGFGVDPKAADASFVPSNVARNTYASPEQLLLDARSDARSDLWALAVSAYELLTTTLPFEATTPAGVTVAICNGQFALPSHYRADLPRAIDGWFATALAKDPAQRFADATEFARGFVQALTAAVEATASKPSSPLSTRLSAAPLPSFPNLADLLEAEEPAAPAAPLSAAALPSVPPPLAASSGAPALSPPVLERAEVLEGKAASAVSHGPPPLSLAADDDSLEMDDGEEDEKTVKWDSPSELPSSFGRAPAAILASVVPHPLGGSPNRVSAAIPGVASARQGAVTQRVSLPSSITGSSLPLGSIPGTSLSAIPPSIEPGVYLDSPYIASVASALAVPSMPLIPEAAPRAQPLFTPDKTWLAALAFAAGVAVTWFAYEPEPEGEAVVPTAGAEFGPDGIRTVSVNDLPPVAGEGGGEVELPAILLPSQLPRATDEAGEPREVSMLGARTLTAPVVKAHPPSEARPAVQKVQALTPAPQPAKAAVRPKVADGRSNCSPPYQIDSQGIQRLKAECLDRPAVVAGPYGAVMTSSAVANPADSAKNVSADGAPTKTASTKPATSDKQARSSTSCSPPYYLDGKIRRLKLECL